MPEGSCALFFKKMNQGMTLKIYGQEEDPRKAEEQNGNIQDKKRRQRGSFNFSNRPVEPEDLRYKDERDGAVTRIK